MNNDLNTLWLVALVMLLSACANTPDKISMPSVKPKMQEVLQDSAASMQGKALPGAPEVNETILQSATVDPVKSASKKAEPRFDLVVNKAPLSQVLMGIASGTPYSIVLSPELSGEISVNLKDVTLFEALNALREVYGLEYKMQGKQIFVEPQVLQTRVFQVNYIASHRKGESGTRVTSGSLNNAGNNGSGTETTTSMTSTTVGNTNATQQSFASSINTSTDTDFWGDVEKSLNHIVGNQNGHSVIVNKQSGLIMVKAMPKELRQVEKFLALMQLTVERQVILEAKILKVQLNKGAQQGINWTAFGSTGGTKFGLGNVAGGTTLSSSGTNTDGVISGSSGNVQNAGLSSGSPAYIGASAIGSSMFAITAQGSRFSALLSFLETQGNVEVLSSPRISTLNNQKAVLKVGTDELFVTNVSNNTTATTAGTTSFPTVTLQPYFSGISLDVTPQIDQENNIILHIHPLISNVVSVNKQISLGSTSSNYSIPVPSSTINETDSIVRTRDGNIIAIGGLMTESSTNVRSKVPVLGDLGFFGNLFRQKEEGALKSELVILLKSTVVKSGDTWAKDMLGSEQRIEALDGGKF